MTLRLRLVLGLTAVALLLAAPLVAAFYALDTTEAAARSLRNQEVAASLLLGHVLTAAQEAQLAETRVGVQAPGDTLTLADLRASAASLGRLADSVRAYHLDVFAGQVARTAGVIAAEGSAEWEAYARHNADAGDSISKYHVTPVLVSLERGVADAGRSINTRAEQHANSAIDAAKVARRQAVLLLIAAAAGALAVSVWLTRSVSAPVRALERGLAAVAGGDFTHALGVPSTQADEFGRLAGGFEQMAAKLAELDRLKSAFVSVASHELKTPINVILGYLTLLNDGLYGPVADGQRDVLATIERQARTLARLVQHLLDVSRFEAGVARLELRPVALRAVLQDAEQAHAVLARQRGVVLRATLSPDLPDVVTWDADRVREVLDNLLTNAVKFTPAGGTVELSAAPDRRRTPPSVQLTVRDTGVGIPADQLPRVFDKFYQANNQSGAAAKGTGLGLAIAKEIVEAHGGVITVDSAAGAGAEFLVTLPETAHDGTSNLPELERAAAEAFPEPAGAAAAPALAGSRS